jgi:subtilisin family serine protease
VKYKILIASLLVATLLSSCTSSVETNPTVPATISPTAMHTATPSPTHTPNVSLTQIEETKIAELLFPYQSTQSNDLSALNRILGESTIKTLWFTQNARWWSSKDKQTAQEILNLGMNPGLGVRELHAEGITGKGVTVAIIDQNLDLDHPEFQGKIVKYYDVGTNTASNAGSLHGDAVTSLLVGENIGTAPDSKVYYVAAPSWLEDAQYYADALDWIIKENEKLPEEDKIRVVSVSTMPSGIWALLHKNNEAWDAAYQRATDAGILVLDCTYEQGITLACTYDVHDPDNPTKCIPNWGLGPINAPHKRINIPTSRTTATEEKGYAFSYQFTGIGGISWTVPYLAGIFAMGWQVNPDLTSEQLLHLMYVSAYEVNYKTEGTVMIINPRAFIEMVYLTINK